MSPGLRNPIIWSLLGAGVFAVEASAAILPAELAARISRSEPMLIIDVRPATAYEAGHIPGAMNIPLGLLPYKQIPASQPAIVYGDGLGLIDDNQVLAILKAKPGVQADNLAGGYAAWLSETRLTTAAPGVVPEKMPGITYDQLVTAAKGDMVLVDLRSNTASIAAAPAAVTAGGRERPKAAAPAPDILAQFAAKLGVPVVASNAVPTASTLGATTKGSSTPARAAAPPTGGGKSERLLVLVADNEAAANEAARQLRASGEYRFTILIGGTDTIRHEGRLGTGRMDGGLPATRQ